MRCVGICVFVLATAVRLAHGAGGGADEAADAFFETRVRPVLADQCYNCHSSTAPKLKGGLYLDNHDAILKGGDSGPALVPHQPQSSRLIEAIGWKNVDLQMPPKHRLTDVQIADLTHWVEIGAPWPAKDVARAAGAARPVFDLQARKAARWCWKPIGNVTPPPVKDAAWARSPIDAFILARLEEKGLNPAPPADRRTLIRRAYFDIIGLPPSPEQVKAFVDDPSPDAFEKVVDGLLASDHFGERWARHWMDLVRYGESRGHEFDHLIPNAWQYRDYLIRAFNADVPYDQFVREAIAGDLLPSPRLSAKTGANESILGTGFWFLGEEIHSPVDIRQDEADRMNNRVDTMTKAFLGLTVGCARCHDHKFDAISQKDFYSLNGFLLSAGYRQAPFEAMGKNEKIAADLAALRDAARPKLIAAALQDERPGLSRLAAYLLASRAILLAEQNHGPPNANRDATAPELDPAILGRWVVELRRAARDPSHLLHPIAAALTTASDDAPSFTAHFHERIDALKKQHDGQVQLPGGAQVLLDFDKPAPADFRADGSAFGAAPVAAGELLLGTASDHPIAGVALRGAARHDPSFPDLQQTGEEHDAGPLGGWHRAGQTIRTAKVTLKTGHLWYLVRGAGDAYAVVDSHLIVDGPLHGDLLHRWNARHDQGWTWVSHDLSAYAGQRCHVEISPAGGPLEIARVIDSASQPPAADLPNGALLSAMSDASIDSPAAMAGAVARLLNSTADRLAGNTLIGSADAADQAQLADFLLTHGELFGPVGPSSALGRISAAFIVDQATLAARVVRHVATAPAMWDGNGVDENILVRGVARNAGPVAPRRFLTAIAGNEQPAYPSDGSGRLRLADEMLANSDPFVPRVEVNRVWYHLFGRGIVPTVDNFGVLGQDPTHLELLDYLAGHFRTDMGWSTKRLIRAIMLSRAYQMSSVADPAAVAADPENLTLHHMPIRRLEAEAIRDAILSVSGHLNPAMGGKPVDIHLTEFMDGRGRPPSGPLDGEGRRSLYLRVRRNFLAPMLMAFDMPTPASCVGRRNVSNVPAQALILMNDPFVADQAAAWAQNVLSNPSLSPQQRIGAMYERALSRQPTEQETAAALSFLDAQSQAYVDAGQPLADRLKDVRAWTDLCHVIFNLKEFIFVR